MSIRGDADPRMAHALATAAAPWAIGWAIWLAATAPRLLKTKRPLMMPSAPAKR